MKTQRGLFNPGQTRGACGVGVLVDLSGRKTTDRRRRFGILCDLDHRGARGAEENTGDGVGMLLQKPHEFFPSSSRDPRVRYYGVAQFSFRTISGNSSR